MLILLKESDDKLLEPTNKTMASRNIQLNNLASRKLHVMPCNAYFDEHCAPIDRVATPGATMA